MEINNDILQSEKIKETDKEVEDIMKKSGIESKFPSEIKNMHASDLCLASLMIKVILMIPSLLITFLSVPSNEWYHKVIRWGLYLTLLVDLVISCLVFSQKVKIPISITISATSLKLLFFCIFLGVIGYDAGNFILYILIFLLILISLFSEVLFIVYLHKSSKNTDNEIEKV